MFKLKLVPIVRSSQVPGWSSAWFSANSGKTRVFRKTRDLGFPLTSRVKPRFTFKPEKFVRFRSLGYTVSYTIYVYTVHSHINCICIRLPGQPCRKVCTPTYSISNVPKKKTWTLCTTAVPIQKAQRQNPGNQSCLWGHWHPNVRAGEWNLRGFVS